MVYDHARTTTSLRATVYTQLEDKRQKIEDKSTASQLVADRLIDYLNINIMILNF